MATEEDVKREKGRRSEPEPEDVRCGRASPADAPLSRRTRAVDARRRESTTWRTVGARRRPPQLGTQRFVYAAYFAGAIGIAFLMSKVARLRVAQAPELEAARRRAPRRDRDAALGAHRRAARPSTTGTGRARASWRKRSRREMSKVTWPTADRGDQRHVRRHRDDHRLDRVLRADGQVLGVSSPTSSTGDS